MIRHYLHREPADDMDDYHEQLAAVELLREEAVTNVANGVAKALSLAFGGK